jgi:hypothetical protein
MQRLLLIAVLLPGCADKYPPKVLVEGHPPRVYERTEGATHIIEHRGWYDAEQLDRIVREYVREKKVGFDFRGTEPQFRVPRDRQFLARATYSSGFGRPVLSATIGWDGHVVEHDLAIAVEGPIGGPGGCPLTSIR